MLAGNVNNTNDNQETIHAEIVPVAKPTPASPLVTGGKQAKLSSKKQVTKDSDPLIVELKELICMEEEEDAIKANKRAKKNHIKAHYNVPKMAVNKLIRVLRMDQETHFNREQEFYALYEKFTGKSAQMELFGDILINESEVDNVAAKEALAKFKENAGAAAVQALQNEEADEE